MLEVLTVIGLVLWIVVSLCFLAAVVYLGPILRRFLPLLVRLERVLERLDRSMDPVLESLRRSGDNMDYITSAIRADVDRVGGTVEEVTRSTRRLLAMAERRAGEINGFLEVVQEEAEETFLTTASLLRTLRGTRPSHRKRSAGGRSS